jgi:hypothetical protein
LFKVSTDLDMNGYYVSMVRIGFARPQEANAKTWDEFQHVDIDGDDINKFPNDVVLLPLAPGEYTQTAIKVLFTRNSTHSLDKNAGGPFQHFVVEPGKITVLGTLDISAAIKVTNTNGDGSQNFDGELSTRTSGSDEIRLELVDMALMRPEAERAGWRDGLEAAREGVYARVREAAIAKRTEEVAKGRAKAEAEAKLRAEAEAKARADAEAKAAAAAQESTAAPSETAAVGPVVATPVPAPAPAAPPPAQLPSATPPAPPVLVASAAGTPATVPAVAAPPAAAEASLTASSSERLGFTLEFGLGGGMASFGTKMGPIDVRQSGPGPSVSIFLGGHLSPSWSLGVRWDQVGLLNDQVRGFVGIAGGNLARWLGERVLLDLTVGAAFRQTDPLNGNGGSVSDAGLGLHFGFGVDLVHGRHNALQLDLGWGIGFAEGSMQQLSGGLAYHLY